MGEGDNVPGAENLAKEEQLKKLQADIMDKVNDMRDKEEISEAEIYDLILRVSNDKSGDIEIFFKQAKSGGSPSVIVSETKVATISDKGITYNAKAINNYLQMCRQYNIPTNEKYEEIEELANLKERQGDNEKTPDEKAQEKQPENEETIEENVKEKKNKDENEQERAPEITQPGKDWIRIGENMQVDAVETVKGEIEEKAGSVAEMYIAPNPKDVHDYKLMVKRPGKNTYEAIPLSNSKGTNPTTNITTFSENGVETTVSVQMLELNDNRMIAVDYNGVSFTNILMVNRTRDNNFIGHKIAGRYKPLNMDKPPSEMRQEALGDTIAAKINTDEMQRNINAIKGFSTQNVPDNVDPSKDEGGIEMYEIRNKEDFRKIIITNIIEDIRGDISGVSEQELYGMATRIAEKMDDGNDYEKAKTDEILAKEDENREYATTNRRGI